MIHLKRLLYGAIFILGMAGIMYALIKFAVVFLVFLFLAGSYVFGWLFQNDHPTIFK